MGDAMSNNAMQLLKYAPVVMVVNGCWMIGNRQVFENAWSYVMKKNEAMLSGHLIWEF